MFSDVRVVGSGQTGTFSEDTEELTAGLSALGTETWTRAGDLRIQEPEVL